MKTNFSNPIRRTALMLGLAASIAAGSLAFIGSASAAPNNNPTSAHDTLCAAFQSGYDSDVQAYESAKTDAARDAARQQVYADIDSYYGEGCDIDHGPINFRQQNPDLFHRAPVGGKQQTLSQNPGQQAGGSTSRAK